MSSNKILLKLDTEVDKIQSFDLIKGSTISANGIIYEKDIISRVEVVKREFSDSSCKTFFIHLFMGNFQLGSIVAGEDYIIEVDNDKAFPRYDIRKAEYFDYKDLGIQED
jgi:hypothetical protein